MVTTILTAIKPFWSSLIKNTQFIKYFTFWYKLLGISLIFTGFRFVIIIGTTVLLATVVILWNDVLSNIYYLKKFAETIADLLSIHLISKCGREIVFKDSLRIFGVSLNELCKVFNVKGKLFKYDPNFNNLNIFKDRLLINKLRDYAMQDSVILYRALKQAQNLYIKMYNVDITSIVSTSSLSMSIFRKSFLKHELEVLKGSEDSFIRKSYIGGSTDYYKFHVKKVKYYDVNSLYPAVMLKPMPHKLLKFHSTISNKNFDLQDFFGFLEVEVLCPSNLTRPLLPHKFEKRTIHPTGTWTGVYFSEELKEVIKHGYTINPIRGYEFSKEFIFNDYVKHFYDRKKETTGAERFIAKMHLNQLYGLFGRRLDVIETLNVTTDELELHLMCNKVQSVMHIDEDLHAVMIIDNTPNSLINQLGSQIVIDLDTKYTPEVKSNVAIASAVTSYARIHMMKYKLHDNICYTDTDSIFITGDLDDNSIGKDLGLMKDELNGKTINEAYFLGIKKYGYYYYNDAGDKITSSVFSGYERDALTFEEVERIANGEVITKTTKPRFFKTMRDLSIEIKPSKISISKCNFKTLQNNIYIPQHIKIEN